MDTRRDRRSTEAPDYLRHPAFEKLLAELARRGESITWNDQALHVAWLQPIPHDRCFADPEVTAAGLFRRLGEYHFKRDRRPSGRLDDTPLAQERHQLLGELQGFQRLALREPWSGRSYGSKRELLEVYVVPWVNEMEDSSRRIFQQLEMLVIAHQQRGLKLIGVPALIEREVLATRYDFSCLWLWMLGNVGVGVYPNVAKNVGDRLELLIADVLDYVTLDYVTRQREDTTASPTPSVRQPRRDEDENQEAPRARQSQEQEHREKPEWNAKEFLFDPGGPYDTGGTSIAYKSG